MIGIDIGSNSIKVVELRKDDGAYQLRNMGEAILPSGSVERKSVLRRDVVSSVLSNLLFGLGIKDRDAAIGVSGKAAVSKIIAVSESSFKKNMKKLMPDLVSAHFSENPQESVYSYVALSEHPGEDGEIPVLIAGIFEETLMEYKETLSSVGLRARVVDIDSMALSSAWMASSAGVNEKVALVNVGASVINISVLNGNLPVLLKDINYGGGWITLRLMEEFDITYEEAERIKYSVKSYARYEQVESIFENFVTFAAREIKTVLDESSQEFERIIFSGGSCGIANFSNSLQNAAGVPVEISNPFRNVAFSDSMFDPEYVKHLAPKMAVAVGLSLREL